MADKPATVARSVELMQSDEPVDSGLCAKVLWAIAADVGLKRITPQIGNTQCNAIGKLMKLKEMEIKYGIALTDGAEKRLALTA
jgi:hypothetical protein